MIDHPTLQLADTHCHLNFAEFDPDRSQVLERATQSGITRILIPGIDIETSKSAIKYSHVNPQIYTAIGVHPNSGLSWSQDAFKEIKHLASDDKVVAIGEIGLDYYRDHAPREIQRSIFVQQLELAADLGLPVVIHHREAFDDLLEILQKWHDILVKIGSRLALHPGELHSYSGSLEFARQIISLNFKLGITGPVTFRNSQLLQSVIMALPLDSFFLETDAPYLSPHPFRGKRNEPANVRIVADKVAELKGIPVEVVAQCTTKEASTLFNWRESH